MRRPVNIVLNTGMDLKIHKADLEKSLFRVVETKEMQRGRMYQIRIEPVLEKLRKGTNTDRLRIHTNQKDTEVLEVPIRFEIW